MQTEEKAGAKALRQEPQQVFRGLEGNPCGWKSHLGELRTERG